MALSLAESIGTSLKLLPAVSKKVDILEGKESDTTCVVEEEDEGVW